MCHFSKFFLLFALFLELFKIKKSTLIKGIDIILINGECEENCLLASRIYAQKYLHRKHPERDDGKIA